MEDAPEQSAAFLMAISRKYVTKLIFGLYDAVPMAASELYLFATPVKQVAP